MHALAVVAVVLFITTTIGIGLYGLRFSRSTSDFFAAARSVSPTINAAAMSGEYISAASFLGVAAVVMLYGIDMLWYPVGFTVGYLVLTLLVAAPLRRSGAYTLPDFAETRMESRTVRRIASILVVLIGWLYLIPQMYAAGITLNFLTGAPTASGGLVVALVVGITVIVGGLRSVSLVQSFHYWVKLAAIMVPAVLFTIAWMRAGSPSISAANWGEPLATGAGREFPFYDNVALVVALFLGTMGLPHVLVRFYSIKDGREARRTSLLVLVLLSAFYIFPAPIGALGRYYAPDLLRSGNTDGVLLALPERVFSGLPGELLGALVATGAFAAFMATASGLVLSVAGVLSQDLLQKRMGAVQGFRTGTALALVVPLAATPLLVQRPLAEMVTMPFAVAASTFCPLLVLGIWWRRVSTAGAIAGLTVGGAASIASVAVALFVPLDGVTGHLLAQPAAWSVPLAFATMVLVSLATPRTVPGHASVTMGRLHTPDKFVV